MVPASAPGQPAERVDEPHRLGQARGLAVEHDPGALGGEVARAEAGAAGGDDQPGEPGGLVAQRAAHRLDAVGRRPRARRPSKPASLSRSATRRAAPVGAAAVGHAVGHHDHLRLAPASDR